MSETDRLRVMVTGARGFIGRHVVAALLAAGHEVARGVRPTRDVHDLRGIVPCDFAKDTHPETWLPRLVTVDAVVNCAGILREKGADKFASVHVSTPGALFEACVMAGVRRVVQVSALGVPEDGEFIASKFRGDASLRTLDLDWVILRPSVVYSTRGSYGGTSLLRAMAALPCVLLLPGDGQQRIAPIQAEDLAKLVVYLVENRTPSRLTLEVVGPESITLQGYLESWRRWLRFPTPWFVQVPPSFVAIAAWFGQHFSDGPLGMTMYRMLTRGNTADPNARVDLANVPGWSPKSLEQSLNGQPSFAQDRWHARLYFLAPVLRLSLAVVWIASAVVGFTTPPDQSQAILAGAGVTTGASTLVWGASGVDLLLGTLLLLNWRVNAVGALMLISLVSYTAFIGMALPIMWLEPFGGLLKNIALMPAVLVMMVLSNRR